MAPVHFLCGCALALLVCLTIHPHTRTPSRQLLDYWTSSDADDHSPVLDTDGILVRACRRMSYLPTLLVRGKQSDVVDESVARDFLSIMPHAEYASVQQAAHMIVGDKQDVFSAVIHEFIARNVRPAKRPIAKL